MKTFDPENYRKLSVPFNGRDEANDGLNAFYDDVNELRKKHHIADVLVTICVNVRYEGGGEGSAMSHAHFGDSCKAESMAAYTYGAEQAARRELINKFLAGRKEGADR